MTPVICDTNIWYKIATNEIDIKSIKDVQLYGTSVNITEISSSPNLLNNIDLVKIAVESFKKHHNFILINNPMDHLIGVFNKDYNPDPIVERKLLNEFDVLLKMDLNKITQKEYDGAKKRLENITLVIQKVVDEINAGLPEIRRKIKEREGKTKHRKIDFTRMWKKFISESVSIYSKEHLDKEYVIGIDDENWKKLEFFIITWENYFKELDVTKTKIKINDWADLFNTVYVQPGFKYWTKDEPWNRLFERNEVLKKYQYNYGT